MRIIPTTALRLSAALALALVIPACVSPEAQHSRQIARISSSNDAEQISATLAESLATAEAAVDRGIEKWDNRKVYNQALEDVLALWINDLKDGKTSSNFNVDGPSGAFHLTVRWPEGLRFDELIPAHSVKAQHLRNSVTREGVGLPLIAHWKHTPERAAEDQFMTPTGYLAPVTATLDFKNNNGPRKHAELVIQNTSRKDSVTIDGRSFAIAYDYSALTEYALDQRDDYSKLRALFRPQEYLDRINLLSLHAPHPDRVPVIFVHGLASEPGTWQNVYNELHADPVLCKHYQVYFFRYPTGVPVLYSAAKLREKLTVLREKLESIGNPHADDIVLVGHSMGGLITKSQVNTPGDRLWINFQGELNENYDFTETQLNELRTYLEYSPNENISRVVFIATPHRGSELADLWFIRFIRKLIEMPGTVLTASVEAVDNDSKDGTAEQLFQSGVPNSIDNLSPESSFVKNTINIPLRDGLKVHSIVGNVKQRLLTDPKCTDGIVPYTSAHIKEVLSELVVPYGHSAHEHPDAIEEIRRILRLHLTELN